MKITLNDAEQALARHLAKSRYDNARSTGKPDQKMGGQSCEETDLEGIAGELVVCKRLNLYPDTDTDLIIYPKYDLLTHKGTKVDVKTTKYSSGRLLATMKKKVEDCDVYVLVVGEFPNYRIVGWAKSEELILKENIINLGHGEGYALNQSQLRSF
tara:strand:+ start:155 stop:622 length:468 start_codon:yes stop_codon:yes gene_type:complete